MFKRHWLVSSVSSGKRKEAHPLTQKAPKGVVGQRGCARNPPSCQSTGPLFFSFVPSLPSKKVNIILGFFLVQFRPCLPPTGRPILSSAGAGGNCTRPMRLQDPCPVLDKNRAPMGPKMLSSTGAGVWRKAPMAFADSGSVLDKFQSATNPSHQVLSQTSSRTQHCSTMIL